MKNTKIASFKKSIYSLIALGLGVSALTAGADPVIKLDSSSCGTMINAGEHALLTEDLSCLGSALTVDSTADNPARLNLGGHTVFCFTDTMPPAPLTGIGIQLTGEGAFLNNGRIQGCDTGVSVKGIGLHHVVNIQANDNDNGFQLLSNSNMFTNNTANGNTFEGFYLEKSNSNMFTNNTANGKNSDGFYLFKSNSNMFTNNTASNNKFSGFLLEQSDSNILTNNTANDNKIDGIQLDKSNSNTLSKNNTDNNERYGIALLDSGSLVFEDKKNIVDKNKAFGNIVFNLFDNSDVCTHNTWTKNKAVYLTTSPDCILDQ